MLTCCRPAEAKPHSARECPGASAQPRGLGPASPTHCAGLVTGHTQRSQPRGLDAGTRPGAGSHIWSLHASGGRNPPEIKDLCLNLLHNSGPFHPEMKKGTQKRRRERPGQCGPRPHPAGGAEEGPPAGLPTSGALSAAETAGAAAGSAGRGRPPTPASAPRPGKKAGPGARPRSPPRRGACALLPPGPPGPPGGHTHPAGAGAGDRLLRGGGEDAGRRQRDAGRGGGRGGRRLAGGGAGPGGGGSGSSHSRQIASRPLRASRRGRWRGRPGDLRVPAAGPASLRPRTRRGGGCAETPPGKGRGQGGSPCGAGAGAGRGGGP